MCRVREVFAIEFPRILPSNHTPHLCVSMHSGSTSFVSTSVITAALPPSFVHVNALGVDFPRVRVGNHSCALPPPRLCTSMHEGSISLASASTITAALPPHLCTSMHEGRRLLHPCRQTVDNHCRTESVCSCSSPAAAFTSLFSSVPFVIIVV